MNDAPRRIFVVLQAPPANAAAFEPVLRIARRRATRIEGVFVEDSRLMQAAGHSFARFVHARSQEMTAMNERVVRRALRVTSVRTRDAFAARVAAETLPWSFTSRACAHLSEAFGDATEGDLVVVPLLRDGSNLGQVGELIDSVRKNDSTSLLVLNERGAPAASILVLFDGDLGDLAAALDLAEAFGCAVTILAAARDEAAANDRAALARDAVGADRPTARVGMLVWRTAADLERAVANIAPGTLVVDRLGETAGGLDIARLLATSDVSLYLRN